MDPSRTDEPDRTALEQRIRAIWQDVLGAADAPAEATFFDLQGQSISAVRIIARLEDELGIVVDVGVLFEDPDLPAFVSSVLAAARLPVVD